MFRVVTAGQHISPFSKPQVRNQTYIWFFHWGDYSRLIQGVIGVCIQQIQRSNRPLNGDLRSNRPKNNRRSLVRTAGGRDEVYVVRAHAP